MRPEVANMIALLRALPTKAAGWTADYLMAHESKVTGLNKKQLRQGARADGTEITPYYSPGYAKQKGRRRPVDLRDTGDFYRSFEIVLQSDSFYIDATDEKTGRLRAKYGQNVLGLAEASKDAVRKDLRSWFVRAIRREVRA